MKRKPPSPDARTVVPGQTVTYHNEPTRPAKLTDALRGSAKANAVPIMAGRAQPKKRKHQRRVRIGLVLPTSVELVVGTDDLDGGDWEILSVVSATCSSASVRTVEENMHDVDIEALAEAAEKAEDEP